MSEFKLGEEVYCIRTRKIDAIVEMRINSSSLEIEYKLKNDINHAFIEYHKILKVEPIVEKLLAELYQMEQRQKEIFKALEGMVL